MKSSNCHLNYTFNNRVMFSIKSELLVTCNVTQRIRDCESSVYMPCRVFTCRAHACSTLQGMASASYGNISQWIGTTLSYRLQRYELHQPLKKNCWIGVLYMKDCLSHDYNAPVRISVQILHLIPVYTACRAFAQYTCRSIGFSQQDVLNAKWFLWRLQRMKPLSSIINPPRAYHHTDHSGDYSARPQVKFLNR